MKKLVFEIRPSSIFSTWDPGMQLHEFIYIDKFVAWENDEYSNYKTFLKKNSSSHDNAIIFEDPLEEFINDVAHYDSIEASSFREASVFKYLDAAKPIRYSISELIFHAYQIGIVPYSKIRSHNVRTSIDRHGSHGMYPPSNLIDQYIRDLEEFIDRYASINPLGAAILAYVALQAIHPLLDGNGRISRIYANYIIIKYTHNSLYLPIVEFKSIFPQASSIALRRAQRLGDWGQIYKMFSILFNSIRSFENCGKSHY